MFRYRFALGTYELRKSSILDGVDPPLFLSGGGEMGSRIRAHAWAATSLGSASAWTIELKTLVSLMLTSPQPMFIAWGPERTWLYNDAFTPILGDKHPTALGSPAMLVWVEAKDAIGPMFDRVFAGEPFYMDDFSLDLERNGSLAEAHFSFSYTPVRDQEGTVAGIFGSCIETTASVAYARLLAKSEERFQLALSAGNSIGTWDWDVAADRVVADARFAFLYNVDPEFAKAGAPIAEFFASVHPDDIERVRAEVAKESRPASLRSRSTGWFNRTVAFGGSSRTAAACAHRMGNPFVFRARASTSLNGKLLRLDAKH